MKKTLSALLTIFAILSAISTIADEIRVVVVPLGKKATVDTVIGDATTADVRAGKTFSNMDNVGLTGTMPDNGALTFNPGTIDQTVPEGYHNGSGKVAGDTDLVPGKIKLGTSIFGVNGTCIETSGTASPAQVLSGQTFSNVSGPATGTMLNVGAQNITPGTTAQPITQGYHNGSGSVAGDADLVTGNIKSGANIFGVGGDSNVVDTSSGDAAAGDLFSGKKAWVDGSEVTGTVPTQTLSNTTTAVSAGYYAATDLAIIDTDLIAENIAWGVTLFGITGTGPVKTITSAGQVWMDRNLGASRAATSMTDVEAFGDLYQWGRSADGHQSRTSPITPTLSTTDTPGHGSYILVIDYPYDWRSPQNDNLWQGVYGINNPCPAGFRIPAEAEWQIERASWSSNDATGAFASPLRLVLAGGRYYYGEGTAHLEVIGYWSSTVYGSYSRFLGFYGGFAGMSDSGRAYGYSVRCIKD